MGLDLDFLVDEELIELPHESRAPVKGSNWQKLADVIASELECLLPRIAASASIVNAWLSSPPVPVPEAALMTYQPARPQVMRVALLQLLETDIPASLLRSLQEFNTRLDIARSATSTFCQHPEKSAVRGGVHIEVLAGLWLAVCAEGGPLLEAMLTASGGADGSTKRSGQITALLDEVAAGGAPCIGADGSVEIPGWAERRRELRFEVDWTAVLRSGYAEWRVQINDFSRGGARVVGEQALAAGSTIDLCFDDGRTVRGQVVWCNGGTSGVKFETHLMPSDPLLSRAMAARR